MKKYILYTILFVFITIKVNAQSHKIDSLYNVITEIKNQKDYAVFYKFQELYFKKIDNKTYKSNLKFEDVFLKALKWATAQPNENRINNTKYYVLKYYVSTHDDSEIISRAIALTQTNSFFKTKKIVHTLGDLIDAYERTEQFSELLKIYPLYYEQIEKHGIEEYKIKKSEQHRAIGLLYYKLKNYKQATKEFKKRAIFHTEENLPFGKCSAENDIGLCFLRQNKWDSAIYYFDKALITWHSKAVQKNIDTYRLHFKNIIYANKASVLMQQKKYDEALPFLFIELNSSKKENDVRTLIPAYHKIAVMYFKKGAIETTLKYIDSTQLSINTFNDNEIKMKSLRLKAKCLLVKGNIEKANEYFKTYENFRDSLETVKAKNRHIAATVKFETTQKEKELLLSKQQNDIQKNTNKYQKVGLIFLTITLLSVFFFLRKTISDKKIITTQKIQFEKALQEKNVLLKEVHHRVKNNLQVINSILDIQNAKIDDERFNKILEEGQNRIQSMALIHQQLYQSDTIVDISMEKYIKELVANIARFHQDKKIDFTILANEIKFKINTSVPLGLIINELITNIYKHAFKKDEKGEVIIGINKTTTHQYKLIVKDNGRGFSKNFDFENTDSLGLKLINILTKQLKGEVICTNDNGAKCVITFRDDVAV